MYPFALNDQHVAVVSRLIVKIEAGVAPCVGKSVLACDRCDFRFDEEFMTSLQFDAFWKHGFDQRRPNSVC
jgi:hypothetical protein